MGDYRLNTFVHAVERDDKGGPTGRTGTFGPGDDLSTADNEWALGAISNPDVWAGDKPPQAPPPPAPAPADGQGDEVQALRARIAELERAAQASGQQPGEPEQAETGALAVPPQRGPGSGAPAWRAYARSVDVQVPEDASREDVIEAVDKAGKPTE